MPTILGGPSILGALKILMLTDSARSILLCLSMSVFSGLAEDEYSIEVSAARRAITWHWQCHWSLLGLWPHLTSFDLTNPTWPHVTLPDLIWPQVRSGHMRSGDLTSFDLTDQIWPYLTLPDLIRPHLTSPDLTWPHLTSPDLLLSHLTCCDLTWPHVTSPDLIWPHLT